MDDAGADVMLVGHTHRPYHRILPRGSGRARHAINTGSVGKPKDGDPRAGYVLVTVDAERAGDDSCAVEVVRVPYDVEAAARAVEAEARLPDAFAAMLREAR